MSIINIKIMNSKTYEQTRLEQLPWIEKYRPKNMDGLYLNDPLKFKLQQFIAEKNIPNIIFTGSCGIGKTSTIRCLAKTLFGKYASAMVLEMNASDDRGMKSMQELIITFCKIKSPIKDDEKNNYANFKLIILDEADNMVERSQPQINNIMETYKNTVRFAFTCNTSSNIIEAIQSKCLILRYSRLTNDLMLKKLISVSKMENVKHDKAGLLQICTLSRGDMRSGLNMLQLIHQNENKITVESVNELCDYPQPVVIKELFDFIRKKNLHGALTILYKLKDSGYSGSDITLGMIYTIKSDICSDILEEHKIHMMKTICMAAYRISKGIDSFLQLASCLVDMINSIYQ